MNEHNENTKRIAKNTFLLYIRMFINMGISLFTSRVILKNLGIEDYGIYSVVGGVVIMFSFLTGSLSSAISRFITYSLETENSKRLSYIFSTSVFTQLFLAVVVVGLVEYFGIWFLKYKLNIPVERETAAQWAMHGAVMIFFVNIVSVPYNATIIAHEKMSAFAYISIFDVVLKLFVAFSLYISPYDKLKTYSVCMVFVTAFISFLYVLYCLGHFAECKLKMVFDRAMFKEMTGFAGWSLLGNGATLLNTQGVNIVSNIFFGVVINAAKGIADQISAITMQFVNNFTTAINPQITKSYAIGNYPYLFNLIFKGSKISFFLMLLFTVPLVVEAEFVLSLWLGYYPPKAPLFVRLVLISRVSSLSY